jgi:PAS domain-containing protein
VTSSEILHDWLLSEKPFRFAGGHVFAAPACLSSAIDGLSPDPKIGRWDCDLLQGDQLTWSDAVYDIFGFKRGESVKRDQSAARYLDSSREVMERLRSYAIRQKPAFVLDAGIDPADGGMPRWVRLITLPVESGGNIVALKGLKVWL